MQTCAYTYFAYQGLTSSMTVLLSSRLEQAELEASFALAVRLSRRELPRSTLPMKWRVRSKPDHLGSGPGDVTLYKLPLWFSAGIVNLGLPQLATIQNSRFFQEAPSSLIGGCFMLEGHPDHLSEVAHPVNSNFVNPGSRFRLFLCLYLYGYPPLFFSLLFAVS